MLAAYAIFAADDPLGAAIAVEAFHEGCVARADLMADISLTFEDGSEVPDLERSALAHWHLAGAAGSAALAIAVPTLHPDAPVTA